MSGTQKFGCRQQIFVLFPALGALADVLFALGLHIRGDFLVKKVGHCVFEILAVHSCSFFELYRMRGAHPSFDFL